MLFSFVSRVCLAFFLFSVSGLLAQQKHTFGKPTIAEKNLETYEKDPSANAVVLYEWGDNYFKVINRRIRLVKEYHAKIKILDEKGFDQATIHIPLYKNGNSKEKIEKFRAVTHNGKNQYNVLSSETFTNDLSEFLSERSFTFPKLQKGSILEYSYTLTSPFFYNFQGWDFQSDIPKIYSEFNAKIPGNYLYNRTLVGSLELMTNSADIKKACFHVDGYSQSADCEVLKYAMKDIPAFKAEKEFMLSEKNYFSRIDFELSQYNAFDGTTDRYTKSWADVDHEFRTDKDIGRQLTKKGFFEKNVPENLLHEGDEITRAKNIYEFVKNHYSWTGKYGVYGKGRVKEAFDAQKGSASEINMSLINLLNAADIETNLMLLSTRDKGLPKQTHPIMSDFNYAIAKVEIAGKTYLLDATDKYMPFGMLPYRALNHYGRVMDFKNDSYWFTIVPEMKNRHQVRANVKFNLASGKAEGILDVLSHGYPAIRVNKDLNSYTESEYLDKMEEAIEGDFKILSYKHLKERSTDRSVSQRFSFEIENALQADMVYFNPFYIRFFDKNPFLLDERQYPIDFGYPRHYKYQLALTLPEGYSVHELPKNQMVQLDDQKVFMKFEHHKILNQVGILFELVLNDSHLKAEDYDALKNVFKDVVSIQKNSLIVLKRESEGSR